MNTCLYTVDGDCKALHITRSAIFQQSHARPSSTARIPKQRKGSGIDRSVHLLRQGTDLFKAAALFAVSAKQKWPCPKNVRGYDIYTMAKNVGLLKKLDCYKCCKVVKWGYGEASMKLAATASL